MKTLDISQYKNYYKKNPKSKYFRFRSDTSRLSRLCDFSNVEIDFKLRSLTEKCLNDRNNLRNLIIENESNVIYTSEGLITTYQTKKFVSFVKDFVKKNIDKKFLDLKFSDIDSTDNSSELVAGFYQEEQEVNGIAPAISFLIPFERQPDSKFKSDFKSFMDKLVDSSYVYGYSFTSNDEYEHDLCQDIKVMIVQFEAKYSAIPFTFEKYLVHVSPLKYLMKILKNGLVPYAKSTEYYYSGRVYLFNKIPEDETIAYAKYKTESAYDSGFCIFMIESDDLINSTLYRSGKLKFYVDSSYEFDGINAKAIYTYSNVPVSLLQKTYLKYEFVDNELKQTVCII